MIEGTDDEDCKAEVELQPLLHHRDGNETVQENSAIHTTRLMFVRHPNHRVNVGISPSPAHILGDRNHPLNPQGQGQGQRHSSRNSNRAIAPVAGTNGNGGAGGNVTGGGGGTRGTNNNGTGGASGAGGVEMGMMVSYP